MYESFPAPTTQVAIDPGQEPSSMILPERNGPYEFDLPISGSVNPYGPHETAEVAALKYFVSNLGKDLAGRFSDQIWCEIFPRVAQHEPAIWNATVAAGMLDMNLRLEGDVLTPNRNVNVALKHYNKAIQELNTRLASLDSAPCRDVVLLSCLLFSVFECLQNNVGLALKHISGGTKLLMEWTHDAQAGDDEGGMYLDRRVLLPIFLALDSHAVQMRTLDSIGFASMPPINERIRIPESFSTADEANLALSSIFNRMGRWALWIEPCCVEGKRPTAMWMAAEERKLQAGLASWDAAFVFKPEALRRHAAGMLLRVQRTVIQIFFDKARAGPSECAFDESLPLFQKGIEEAEMYTELTAQMDQQHDQSQRSRRVFTTAMDIVMALFVMTTRCRDAKLRRRALAMLKTCNRTEGIWDSQMCSIVAERFIQLEESAALPDGFIPEGARIYEMDVSLEEDGGQVIFKRHVRNQDGTFGDDIVVSSLYMT